MRALQETIQGYHLHHNAAHTVTNTDAILIAAARLAARPTQHCWKQSKAAGAVSSIQAGSHPEGQYMTPKLAVITAAIQETDHQQQPTPKVHSMEQNDEETEAIYYDCQEPTMHVPCYYDCEQPPASWLSWDQKQASGAKSNRNAEDIGLRSRIRWLHSKP